jgi:hypothetical protein
VIRQTIRSLDKVALGRVVLTSREHVIAFLRGTNVMEHRALDGAPRKRVDGLWHEFDAGRLAPLSSLSR